MLTHSRFLPILLAAALTLGGGFGRLGAQELAEPGTVAAPGAASAAAAAPVSVGAPQVYRVASATQPAEPVELGSLEASLPYKMKVGLEAGAIWYIHLTDYLYDAMADPAKPQNHYLVQSKLAAEQPGAWYRPLASLAVVIDGQRVDLSRAAWELLDVRRNERAIPVAAVYRLVVADNEDRPTLEVRRTLELAEGSYELLCRQTLVNLGARPLRLVWEQYGQAEAPREVSSYGIDPRGLWMGYFDLKHYPAGNIILVDDNTRISAANLVAGKPIPWPPSGLEASQVKLAWAAMVNRYFAAAVHRPVALPVGAAVDGRQVQAMETAFPSLGYQVVGPEGRTEGRYVLVTLRSGVVELAPRGEAELDLALFAGPRSPQVFKAQLYQALNLGELVHYSLGGCCAILTFQWLARMLMAFMSLIHAVTLDWAMAIIFLVLAVRLVLHPLTRKGQIQTTKMGKQMAALKPELDALKRKYEKDPRRLQTEQARLMREKGVSPAAMLGCLPMFLQTPIWIALYAMLYYAIELRHQPAFWGVFQAITAGKWTFLADLSSPDRFWVFADHPLHLNFPLLAALDFSSLNILPLVWTIVMFVQQKMMSPPPANEQAAQQQKIMMYSMLLFPLFLYSAPSGLTLYILVSSVAGILDSWVVRRHIKREEEEGRLLGQTRKAKGWGFFDRIRRSAQEAQKQREDRLRRLGDDDRPRYRKR